MLDFIFGATSPIPVVLPNAEWIIFGGLLFFLIIGGLIGMCGGWMTSLYISGSYLFFFFLSLGLFSAFSSTLANTASGVLPKVSGFNIQSIVQLLVDVLGPTLLIFLITGIGTILMLIIYAIFFKRYFKRVRRSYKTGMKITSRLTGAAIGAMCGAIAFTPINNLAEVAIQTDESSTSSSFAGKVLAPLNTIYEGMTNNNNPSNKAGIGKIKISQLGAQVKQLMDLAADPQKTISAFTDLGNFFKDATAGAGTAQGQTDLTTKGPQIVDKINGLLNSGLLDNPLLPQIMAGQQDIKQKISDGLAQLKGIDDNAPIPDQYRQILAGSQLKDPAQQNKFLDFIQSMDPSIDQAMRDKLTHMLNRMTSQTAAVQFPAVDAHVTSTPTPGTTISQIDYSITQTNATPTYWNNSKDYSLHDDSGVGLGFYNIQIAVGDFVKTNMYNFIAYHQKVAGTSDLANMQTNYNSAFDTAFAAWQTAESFVGGSNYRFLGVDPAAAALSKISFTNLNINNNTTNKNLFMEIQYWSFDSKTNTLVSKPTTTAPNPSDKTKPLMNYALDVQY